MNKLATLMHLKKNIVATPYVAVVGGGIAGATAALHLAELGIKVVLIEKDATLVSGPPICHLHAGGNLYREISTSQCIELLKQSIETVRLYPHTLNRRPTVIAVPHTDGGEPDALYGRLKTIQQCYATLVEQDAANEVLGDPDEYYRTYQRNELETLAQRIQPQCPQNIDDWMIPFAKSTDLDSLKFPIIAVQEHGWSVFRLAASVTLALESMPRCQILTQTQVTGLEATTDGWAIECRGEQGDGFVIDVDYLVNACGYQTGRIDDLAQTHKQRLVEFKAAYVTRWAECNEQWPEVIFHGPRGTPSGMAQLTPYPGGIFQLHGMTKDITLFDGGLVSTGPTSSQPTLPAELDRKLEQGWEPDVVATRTRRAIEHIAQFIPDYHTALESGTPLFGAQQIPGNDDTLRAADVTFESHHYARIEVVKGSSALEAATKIVREWALYDYRGLSIEALHPISMSLSPEAIEQKAQQLAEKRLYPKELARFYGQ
ncbi:FAD-dependent oxidoreductase [Vibrio ostreicida]|uniref:FAD-dependent oxidoreductase n=1 Tax=Vibrio ostreicida TaxID=526588 RepID=UPI003B5BB3DA